MFPCRVPFPQLSFISPAASASQESQMSTAERDQFPARFPTEETPLLPGTVDEAQSPPQPQTTPLPYAQLAALCLVRLVDPLNFTQIFPYVNRMMLDVGAAKTPADVGASSSPAVVLPRARPC